MAPQAGGGSRSGNRNRAAVAAQPGTVQKAVAATVASSLDWNTADWPALVGELALSGAVRMLASNCAFLRFADGTAYLSLDSRSESLLTKARQNEIATRLSERCGSKVRVEISIDAVPEKETPVQQESRLADERMEAARQSLESDPNVQTLKNMFGAELKSDTIEIIAGDKT